MEIASLYQLYLKNRSVQTDTRKLISGDIFFALKGPNFDGNQYARAALEKGAAYAVVDDSKLAGEQNMILVDDVLATLQQLALHHRKQLTIPFVAITGSNGKTTTKELITVVLKERYITYATEGNLNNHIGVPLTILKIKENAEIAVIEMGANHLREIASYCQIALPTHAIITNCGKAHIEGFGGEEGVRKGKGELYDFIRASSGTIFRNVDLPYLAEMAHDIEKQILYGEVDAQYIGTPVIKDVKLGVKLHAGEKIIDMQTNLVGAYNFPNVMAAVAVGLHFEVPVNKVTEAIISYEPDNSRSQWVKRGNNNIILDAYNANPTSMKAAIDNFAATQLDNKILYIGAMKEMGTASVYEHKVLVDMIKQYPWQDVVLVGSEFGAYTGGFAHFNNSAEARDYIMSQKPPGGANILIKGSRGSRMEVILDAI